MTNHITGLTHWGRVTHICISKLTNIGSDNGLSPGRHQAIIWTNPGILLIGPWGTNFSDNLIGIQTFSLKKMLLKMSSAKWRPFHLGLNVLTFCVSEEFELDTVLFAVYFWFNLYVYIAVLPSNTLSNCWFCQICLIWTQFCWLQLAIIARIEEIIFQIRKRQHGWPRGHLNIKMPSYQDGDSHCKDKVVSWLIFIMGIPLFEKTVFILKQAPGSKYCALSVGWTAEFPWNKSHNAPVLYPTMHNFVTETYTHFCYKMVHCGIFNAFWDFWDEYSLSKQMLQAHHTFFFIRREKWICC